MPYAMERSVASPMISARLPARNPIRASNEVKGAYCASRRKAGESRRCRRRPTEYRPRSADTHAAKCEPKGLDARTMPVDVHDQALTRLDHVARQAVPPEQIRDADTELRCDA